MAEPISTIVGALVSLFTAYTTYKVGMVQAEQSSSEPEKIEGVKQGEQTIEPVRVAVQKYGSASLKDTFEMFEKYPDKFNNDLEKALIDLAQRNTAFDDELRNIAWQNGIVDQSGKVQITVGKGTAINTMKGGTINMTFD